MRAGSRSPARCAALVAAAALIAFSSPGAPPAEASDVLQARCPATVASAYSCRVLVDENPLMKSTGMVIDNDGFLYSADVLRNAIFRVNLDALEIDRIAHDFEPAGRLLVSPHTLELDHQGRMYVTEYGLQTVRRLDRDGNGPRVLIAANAGSPVSDEDCGCDVATGTSGIAFNSDGRLFVVDNVHDRDFSEENQLGGLWEVDLNKGFDPLPREIAGGLGQVEEISFVPDEPHLAYVTDPDGDRVNVVDVNTGEVRSLTGFDRPYGNEYDSSRDALLISEYSGNLWQVDPDTGDPKLLARSDRPLGSMAIDPRDNTVYVSNGIYGGLWRLDESIGRIDERLVPVLPEGWFAIPTSLNEPPPDAGLPPGSFWVADWTGISTVTPDGNVTRVEDFDVDDYNPLNRDDPQWLTPGVLQVDRTTAYFGETGFSRDTITRFDLRTHKREVVIRPGDLRGPYHVRLGPDGDLLVSEQPLVPTTSDPVTDGRILRIDPDTEPATVTSVMDNLLMPGGLRYDPVKRLAYVSEVVTGRIWTVNLDTGERAVVAQGLDAPEGLDVDGAGGLIVVEGEGARRLLRFDVATCAIVACVPVQAEEIARGLRTKLRGPIPKPLPVELPADVLVRDDGSIVVTTPEDARVLVFEPARSGT